MYAGVAYLSGIVPDDFDGPIAAQAAQVFHRIDALLASVGSRRTQLLSVTVYLKTFEDYDAFRAAYAQWIDPAHLPARATVRADLRDPRIRIEIMASAAVPIAADA